MKLRKQAAVVSKRMRMMTPRESAEYQLSLACRLRDWEQAKLWLAELVAIGDAEEMERSERAAARFDEVFELRRTRDLDDVDVNEWRRSDDA